MKRPLILLFSSFFLTVGIALAPTQATASSCPVSVQQASQILGYPVELKDLGVMGCNYVGKRGLATLMIYVAPTAADAERRVQQVRSRIASPPARGRAALSRVAVDVGSKGTTFVQISVQPKDQRAAAAFISAVLAKL